MKYSLIKRNRDSFALGIGLVVMFTFFCGSNGASQAQMKEACFGKSEVLVRSLPEKVGELKKDPDFQFFTSEKLFDYMDGGAEHYLRNGFVCLFVQEYQIDKKIIILEIYQFEDKIRARKMYLQEAALKGLDLGEQGSYEKCYVVYHIENYMVKIMCFDNGPMNPLLQLATAVEKIFGQLTEGRSVPLSSKKDVRRDLGQKKDCIVFIGASYARGWNLTEIADITIVNNGIAGEQSFEMLSRFNEDVIFLKPTAVIIWGFINDIFRSKREEIGATIERAKKSYEEMVKLTQENGITPILATEVTIRPRHSWSETLASWVGRLLGKKSYQDYVNQHVLAMNQWVKEYARRHHLLLLDLQPVISDKHGKRKKEYATEDGSHISSKGYEKLTLYARNQLLGYFKDK